MSETLKLGELFQNKYQIEREIGRGSFGAVYLARQRETSEHVAIKVLLPWMKDDAEMRHRFKREAKLASHLKCESAVRLIEFGEADDGDLYIVMEFLHGLPLDEVLAENGPLPPDRVVEVTKQVLESLSEAHKLGIVHRDLKPPNLFVSRASDGREIIKVFDYGIAKIVGGENPGSLTETTKLTVRGGLVGTPVYMSPEQCRGEPLTPASDLYSLGICMYEMLTGDVPFDHPNPVQVMIMHNDQKIPALPSGLAKSLAGRVMMRALAKTLDQRFRTADDFLAAFSDPSILDKFPPPKTPSASEEAYRDTMALSVPEELSHQDRMDKSLLNPAAHPPEPAAGGMPVWAYALFGLFSLLLLCVVALLVIIASKS